MQNSTRLDVLIVYNEKAASSAYSSAPDCLTPFPPDSSHADLNTVYGYFLDICRRQGLKAGLASSADIIGSGRSRGYWRYRAKTWHKLSSPCYSTLIFTKFSPTTKSGKLRRQLLFSSPAVNPCNDPLLFNLFFDKQKTYDTLSKHSIPTVSLIKNSLESIKESCQALDDLVSTHSQSDDFSHDIIMKDRYGAGGQHVYKFKPGQTQAMLALTAQNQNVSFIIQPFAKFDQGFSFRGSMVSTDIRLIYLDNKVVDSYVRTAKADDFRCNQHQGGTTTYLSTDQIPKRVMTKSTSISRALHTKHSLYSLDFIVSNNGNPYLLEGNSGPGLDWNTSIKQEELNTKKFIRTVVQNLALRLTT